MAFVILHPHALEKWKENDFAQSLKKHARKTLPGFATPEWVEVVPQLPVRQTDEY